MFSLPVSGAAIMPRNADGSDDMLLAEAQGTPVEIGIALLARLCGEEFDAPALVVTDFESLLLQLRAARFGQVMTLGFACPHCRALAEISFRVAEYLAEARPRQMPGVMPHPSWHGWYRLGEAGFRLPTAGDQAAVAGLDARLAEARLAERCMDETARARPHRARVERAMEAMAPSLSREIEGQCPACGEAVQAGLVVANLVIGEFRRAAAAVHDEVDLIARAYHWPEPLILSLPQSRRRAYVDRIRRGRAQAA
ncbi:MAG TPA: hypothetical protein VKS60_19960 [Stellaceae bacterium]|nr:hypothetical protein [Stellaceae bacterium]